MKYSVTLPNVEKPLQYKEVQADYLNVHKETGQILFMKGVDSNPIHVAPPTAFVQQVKG